MTVATLIYGIVPLFVDLTETHVFHPDLTPHSRMHMVWLLGTNSSLAVMALFLLWLFKEDRAFGIRLAGALGLCVYGGSLSVKGAVPPILGMDANIVGFSPGLLVLTVGWARARFRSA